MRTLLTRAVRVLAARRHRRPSLARRGGAIARAVASVVEPLESRRLLSTYYVSPAGNNANDGTSPAAAFKSISKVNALDLNPGDAVLFQGGATFDGSVNLTTSDSGTATSPVVIGSYGAGRATIRTAAGRGIAVNNAGGIRIENLNFVGTSYVDTNYGIKLTTYAGGKRDWIRVNNVDVSGFGQHGISVVDETAGATGGFNDVRITNAVVHHNVSAGIKVHNTSKLGISHSNVYIADVVAHSNMGSALYTVSGSGIEVAFVDGAMIERCVAYNNSETGMGAVAIWAHDANRVTIQYCEAYDQHTTDEADGTGFGFDTNTSNSVMQYNWSHGNDGHGINLAQWRANDAFTNNVVRYNLIQNNGRKNGYGGISVWGRVLNTHVYNNTIYQGSLSRGASGPNRAIRMFKAGTDLLNGGNKAVYPDNVYVRNNIIVATGGARLVDISSDVTKSSVRLFFQGNAYWTYGSPFRILHGGVTHTDLASWRAARGQEVFNGRDAGFVVDPKLTNPGGGSVVGSGAALHTMTAYLLTAASPLFGQALPAGLLSSTTRSDVGAGVIGRPDSRPWVISGTGSAAQLAFRFNEDVRPSLGRVDFVITNRTTGASVTADQTLLQFDPVTNIATLTFPALANGRLASGVYSVRVRARGITDVEGNRMVSDFNLSFTV